MKKVDPIVQENARLKTIKIKAKREFVDWKQSIKRIIDKESELMIDPKTGSYRFILPKTLISLVWQTTIKERARLEKDPDERERAKKALQKVRAEVDAAAKEVAEKGSRVLNTEEDDQEEQAAKAALDEMRKQIVEEKEGNN